MMTPGRRAKLREKVVGDEISRADLMAVLDALDAAEARERRLRDALSATRNSLQNAIVWTVAAGLHRNLSGSDWMSRADAVLTLSAAALEETAP